MVEWKTSGTGITQRKRKTYDLRDPHDLGEMQRRKWPVSFSTRLDKADEIARFVLRIHGLAGRCRALPQRI